MCICSYDPASNAYAYVPARALNEHFTSPKKPTQLVQKFEDQQGREVVVIPPPPSSTNVVGEQTTSRRPITPKWEDDIDIPLIDESTRNSRRPIALPLNNTIDATSSSTQPRASHHHRQHNSSDVDDDDDVEEKPEVCVCVNLLHIP